METWPKGKERWTIKFYYSLCLHLCIHLFISCILNICYEPCSVQDPEDIKINKIQSSGSSNTLATWFKEPTYWKRLMLGKLRARGEGGDREWDGWMASLTQWTWVWVKLRELVMDREAWRAAAHGVGKSRTGLSNWTELFPKTLWAWQDSALTLVPRGQGSILFCFLVVDWGRFF